MEPKRLNNKSALSIRLGVIIATIFAVISSDVFATTKTATANGNWSNPAIWSPVGVPAAGDDVIINSARTVTVDSIFVCNNLDLGNSTGSNTTLNITSAANSLTINGDFRFNPSNKGNTFTLDAGPGTINVAGTFSYWATSGTNEFKVSTGTLNFIPAVTIVDGGQKVTFTGAGTVTFNSHFADDQDNLILYTGCTVNFHGNYTVTGADVDWENKGTANFYGTGTITHDENIYLNHTNIIASATTTLAAGAGVFKIEGDLTLNSSSSLVMSDDFELNGHLTNNGGSISAGAVTLTMHATAPVIGGTTSLSLPTLCIGSSAGKSLEMNLTVGRSLTVTNLTFAVATSNRQLILSSSGVTLNVTGDITLNQPTKNSRTCLLAIGAGTCNVTGNLVFTGTNNTITRICKVNSTSGTLNLNGNITWMSNNVVATEEISTATGEINFANAVTMGTKSATLKVTGAGVINFNSTSNPCFTFGGATAPVFTTTYGSTINFAKGITTATTALTFAVGSEAIFKGTSTITPGATITFGDITIDPTYTVTAAGNFAVKGNWMNYGTFTPGTYTVTFNGGSTQSITNSAGTETFYGATFIPFGTVITLNDDVVITNTMTMNGASADLNGHTLQLGNGSGAALVYSLGQCYNGTFKRYWPSGTAITSTSGNYYGLFPIGGTYEYRPITINSTVNATTGGYVMAAHYDTTGVRVVTYTDNEGSSIEAIALVHSDITTSGLVGGTYNIGVKFTGMGSQGNVSNLKLVTHTANTIGSAGTHATTAGPLGAPTGYRNGLSVANLNNAWVLGTNDRNATPMYNYVYSRKSGNWNDDDADGTWSYTPGGSGASCNCTPGASGYAIIEAGQTVTVTASDAVQFLDIETGGGLTVNFLRTFSCTGNMSLEGTATFTNNGTLNVTGELLMSSVTSPTVNGNVNITGWFTLPTGTTYTQSDGTLTVSGDMDISGNLDIASGASLVFNGTGKTLRGTGTYTTASGGSFPITNNKLIYPGTNLTIGSVGTNTTLSVASNTTINNVGNITVYGNVTGGHASSTVWINNATSSLNVSGTILSTGLLDAETGPNTVSYIGTGAQTIKAPATAYYNLSALTSGTKTLTADAVVINSVNLAGSAILDESTYILSGDASLNMSGTSELKLQRSSEEIYPELNGTYNLTGGTVTINQTADSAIVHPGRYYNLKLNGATPYDISAVNNIDNNLEISNTASIRSNSELTVGGTLTHSSSGTSTLTDSIAVYGITLSGGTLRDGTADYEGGQSINVTGAGGWNKNGGTFTVSDGAVCFSGNDNQSLNGSGAAQTFNNLYVNKGSGTVTVTGSTTTLSMNGNMTLTGGTFDVGTATAINMTAGNWINNGGTLTPGSGTVTFNGTVDQGIQGIGIAQTFNNITVNKASGTLTVGGSTTSLTLNGNMTLTAGTFNNGTATSVYMTGGNWTNNGGTYTPGTGAVVFTGTGAQAVNGTAASQTFNGITVNKSSGTLSVSGSTTALTVSSNVTLTAGTFDKGTATTINAGGDWTNNGGTFTYGTGTVNFNGTGAQAINGSAGSNTFYNATINKSAGTITLGNNQTLNIGGTATLTAGTFDGGSSTTINVTAGNWTNNGGTFTPSTSTLVFNSTAGAQAINGTAASQTFNNVQVNKAGQALSVSGSTTALNLNGDMILTAGTFDKNTATAINVGGNWTNNGGGFTYGTGTVTFNGSAAQAINGSAATQTFYNTTVNKGAGTLTLSGSTTTLNIGGQMTLTAGTFNGGASTTINMTAGNWTNNGGTFAPATSTVVFNATGGAQAINGTAASQTFNNVTIQKSSQTLSVSGSTATLNMNGNLAIETGTFDKGTASSIAVGANWTNNSTFIQGAGTVTFNGGTPQSITGSTVTTFNNLTIYNSSTGVTLNNRATVTGNFNLNMGLVHTTAVNLLTLTATAASTAGNSEAFVDGPMKKIGNTDFVFPVGKAGKWRRVKVSELETITTEITGEYFAAAYANTIDMQAPLNQVSEKEYWDINREVTADDVKIALYWENADSSSINSCDFLTLAHFTGGKWVEEPATATMGSVCSGNGAGSIEMTGTVSTFSPFSFGGSGGTPLPIKLVSFDATLQAETVKTTWVTSLEINNDYFTVERSADGVEFTEAGKVEGAGNSTVSNTYTFYDENPLEGTSYYRLKQTDYDGAFTYSNTATVNRNGATSHVNVYPNPATDAVNISVSNTASDIEVSIYDQFGKRVYQTNYPVSGKRSQSYITLQTNGVLSAGIYFMNVATGQTNYQEKLIIQ